MSRLASFAARPRFEAQSGEIPTYQGLPTGRGPVLRLSLGQPWRGEVHDDALELMHVGARLRASARCWNGDLHAPPMAGLPKSSIS